MSIKGIDVSEFQGTINWKIFSPANRYAYWYARYTNHFDGSDCSMLQYTSEGSVPGIGGDVDLDICYENFPKIIRQAGLNHLFGSSAPGSGSNPSNGSSPGYFTYLIRLGDTLIEIVLRYGTTIKIPK